MASIYFAGQLNQYHVQYDSEILSITISILSLLALKLWKHRYFLENCEENSDEEQRELFKGLPQMRVMRQGCKAQSHFKPKECRSGVLQSAQHATYKGITTAIRPKKFNWSIS